MGSRIDGPRMGHGREFPSRGAPSGSAEPRCAVQFDPRTNTLTRGWAANWRQNFEELRASGGKAAACDGLLRKFSIRSPLIDCILQRKRNKNANAKCQKVRPAGAIFRAPADDCDGPRWASFLLAPATTALGRTHRPATTAQPGEPVMVIELVRNRSPDRKINQDLIVMLREVLELAEAGELQAAAVAYVNDHQPMICYEAEGFEADISCAARQIDEEMRSAIFDEADAI
jgi:hypothetical protein